MANSSANPSSANSSSVNSSSANPSSVNSSPAASSASLPPYFIKYRRVSTGKQVEKDLSLPAQAREQDEAIEKAGGLVLGDFEDGGISGKTPTREGFQAALALAKSDQTQALLKKGHRVFLLVWKSNRAFRNRHLAINTKHDLKQIGVRILSITEAFVGGESLGDKTMEGIMEVVDEIKVEQSREDTLRGLRQMAQKQGRQLGSPPFGYRLAQPGVQGAGVVWDEPVTAFVLQIFESFAAGLSLAEVTRTMNETGFRSPMQCRATNRQVSGQWLGTSIRKILQNRFYIGEVKWRDPKTREIHYFPGIHPPLVPRGLFDRVQERLTLVSRGRRSHSLGIFSGLLHCPLCGSLLYTHTVNQVGVTGMHGGALLRSRYHCGQRARNHRAHIYGARDDQNYSDYCAGWQIGERAFLRLFEEYLREDEIKSNASAKARRAFLARSDESVSETTFETTSSLAQAKEIWPEKQAVAGNTRVALLAEKQIAEEARAAFSWQHAHKFLTDDAFIENVHRTDAQIEKINTALAKLDAAPPPEVFRLTPAQAEDLRSVLASKTLSPAQKRQELARRIDHIVPSEDKTSLDVHFL